VGLPKPTRRATTQWVTAELFEICPKFHRIVGENGCIEMVRGMTRDQRDYRLTMLIRENCDKLRWKICEDCIGVCVAILQSFEDAIEVGDGGKAGANSTFPHRCICGVTCKTEAVAGGSTITYVQFPQCFPIFQFPRDETSPVKMNKPRRRYRLLANPITYISSHDHGFITALPADNSLLHDFHRAILGDVA
jgi:hypothetical protein